MYGAGETRPGDIIRQKQKNQGVSTKRVPLGVIDCNVDYGKKNSLEPAGKLQRPQSPAIPTTSDKQIFLDEDEEFREQFILSVLKNSVSPSFDYHRDLQRFSDLNRKKAAGTNRLSVFKNLTHDSVSVNSYLGLPFNFDREIASAIPQPRSKKRNTDLLWFAPYREDIFSYFKSIEKKYLPKADYMDKQSDITMNMRCVLVDWLIEVGEEYKLELQTLFLSISYIDRFLSQMSVFKEKLQLVGTASMFVATKYEEIYPPELKDFAYITDDTYSKHQIVRMEHLLLKVLNFDVSVPTSYSFLQLYCAEVNASLTTTFLSQYICELSLLDGDPFLAFPPSVVAGGAYALAQFIQGQAMWDKVLEELSGYQLSDLTNIISCLYDKYASMPTCQQQATFEKYKSSKYRCVSTIKLPEGLNFTNG